jgi:hypothetical protein
MNATKRFFGRILGNLWRSESEPAFRHPSTYYPDPPHIHDPNKICYLLLYLGAPSWTLQESEAGTLLAVQQAAELALGISIRTAYLTDSPGSRRDMRYLFSFPDDQRNDRLASEIAETFVCAVSILHEMQIIETDILDIVMPIPLELIHDQEYILIKELLAYEEARPFDSRTLPWPSLALRSSTCVGEEYYEAAWRITPILLRNETLRLAVHFLKSSRDKFSVLSVDIPEILAKPDRSAESGLEQSRLEDALQNAFKAVEAIIGDPPRDDRRFRAKLVNEGLDPDMLVGYSTELPLDAMIRRMSRARDTKAAHGSTPNRRITIVEMLEYQECAFVVVLKAIENALGERLFPALDFSLLDES